MIQGLRVFFLKAPWTYADIVSQGQPGQGPPGQYGAPPPGGQYGGAPPQQVIILTSKAHRSS